MDASEATKRYRALRGKHRIVAVPGPIPGERLCATDGVRVFSVKVKGNKPRLRHDRGDIGALLVQAELSPADDRRLRGRA